MKSVINHAVTKNRFPTVKTFLWSEQWFKLWGQHVIRQDQIRRGQRSGFGTERIPETLQEWQIRSLLNSSKAAQRLCCWLTVCFITLINIPSHGVKHVEHTSCSEDLDASLVLHSWRRSFFQPGISLDVKHELWLWTKTTTGSKKNHLKINIKNLFISASRQDNMSPFHSL